MCESEILHWYFVTFLQDARCLSTHRKLTKHITSVTSFDFSLYYAFPLWYSHRYVSYITYLITYCLGGSGITRFPKEETRADHREAISSRSITTYFEHLLYVIRCFRHDHRVIYRTASVESPTTGARKAFPGHFQQPHATHQQATWTLQTFCSFPSQLPPPITWLDNAHEHT